MIKVEKVSVQDVKDTLYRERILFHNLLRAEVERQTDEERRSLGYQNLAQFILLNHDTRLNDMNLQKKLDRPDGLCTSVAKNDEENAARINFILNAAINDRCLQMAPRSASEWETVHGLPMNFSSFRYRTAQ
jgi:hypothetical protein